MGSNTGLAAGVFSCFVGTTLVDFESVSRNRSPSRKIQWCPWSRRGNQACSRIPTVQVTKGKNRGRSCFKREKLIDFFPLKCKRVDTDCMFSQIASLARDEVDRLPIHFLPQFFQLSRKILARRVMLLHRCVTIPHQFYEDIFLRRTMFPETD